MESSSVLKEDSILLCCPELESDVTGCGSLECGELNDSIGATECHSVVKQI